MKLPALAKRLAKRPDVEEQPDEPEFPTLEEWLKTHPGMDHEDYLDARARATR